MPVKEDNLEISRLTLHPIKSMELWCCICTSPLQRNVIIFLSSNNSFPRCTYHILLPLSLPSSQIILLLKTSFVCAPSTSVFSPPYRSFFRFLCPLFHTPTLSLTCSLSTLFNLDWHESKKKHVAKVHASIRLIFVINTLRSSDTQDQATTSNSSNIRNCCFVTQD